MEARVSREEEDERAYVMAVYAQGSRLGSGPKTEMESAHVDIPVWDYLFHCREIQFEIKE
jgi:hypothetical protein